MPRNVADFCMSAIRGLVAAGERYGCEVETEGMSHERALTVEWPTSVRRAWAITHDGSLRNGMEWVSIPLSASALQDAVRALWSTVFNPMGPLQHASVRTGIHIHVNCIGMTTAQVLRMLQHYALVEPLLFAAVGNNRDENIYCIPWYRSIAEPRRVYQWLGDNIEGRSGEQLMEWDNSPPTCKYSALNVSPLSSKGTVEFRHAPTFTSATDMLRWWDLVSCVYRTWDTDYDVLEQYAIDGPMGFAERVFRNVAIPVVSTSALDDLDVVAVAEALAPPRIEVAPGWGTAPELQVTGTVVQSTRFEDAVAGLRPERAGARVRRIYDPQPVPAFAEPEDFGEFEPPEADEDDDDDDDDDWDDTDDVNR